MNEMTSTTRPQLGTYFRDTGGEEENWPQIALASEIRAIDLSCLACGACGALALGAGLGFPVGHPQPLTGYCPKTWRLMQQKCAPGRKQ